MQNLSRKYAVGLALVALSGAAPATAQPSTPTAATAHPAIWPVAHWPWKANQHIEIRIHRLLAAMSIEEKVGQILQADINSVTPDDVRQYHLGAILNGGNSGPNGNDFAPAPAWLKLADAFYDASRDRSHGGHGIPIMWGTDAVHGHSNIIGATLFPHNSGLGAMHDPALIRRIAAATAAEVRTTGIDWTFAPTITVPQDLRWGRAYEGYSSDPNLVASYAAPMIEGLQGKPNASAILAGPHVIATAKHFLADGGTAGGHDQGDARMSEAMLREIHGKPYVAAINAGVLSVMVSFSSWNGEKMTGNRSLVTDVLKHRLGFGGMVISDWNAHGQVNGCTTSSCPRALNAGIDMMMAPDSWKSLRASLLAQVRSGEVPVARLNAAVASVLRMKLRAGLFEAGRPSTRVLAGHFELLGSADHRATARQAVRESLVLLKNHAHVLPLALGGRILVAGDGADDIARQSGGWTISWQGTGLPGNAFPGATSIWQGNRAAVTAAGGEAILAPDGAFAGKRPDAAIVVFGETPYAEFQGDIPILRLKPEQRTALATMRRLKAAGIPVVAVMLTGRPLWTNPELNVADAFIVGWLPGSEGEGVADMLLRPRSGLHRDFTGRLSFAWPGTARADGPQLFPFGYGLSLHETGELAGLSEDPGAPEYGTSSDVFMTKGTPMAGWSLQVDDGAMRTAIGSDPAKHSNGQITVEPTDFGVQEGARRFKVDVAARAQIALYGPSSVDLARQTNGDVALIVTMRIDKAAVMPMRFGIGSGGKTGWVTLDQTANFPIGQWRTLAIPLKCFEAAGAKMAAIDMPLDLDIAGPATISLADVRLGSSADRMLACVKPS